MSTATELLRRALEHLDLAYKHGKDLDKDIRAFLAAAPEAETVTWPVDREWLRTVLRFAEKNPDYFYDVEPGFISLDSGDTDTIITALNKSAEPARKPMTEEEAIELCPFTREEFKAGFLTGVRFAEKHHGITE